MTEKIRRYPSIRSFQRNEQQLFIGRETETQQLFNKVISQSITLVFARSGIGKSSLINAGLIPLLEKRGLLPVELRLQQSDNRAGETALDVLKWTLRAYFDERTYDADLAQIKAAVPDYQPGLWEYFKCCNFPLSSTPVFILDQFEQFFTFSRSVQDEFMLKVNELLADNVPLRFLEFYNTLDEPGKIAYSSWLEQPDVKIVFAIRSDKIFELNRLTAYMPAILRNRFELSPLNKTEAKRAIETPAAANNKKLFATAPFQYHPDLLEKILQNLSGSNDIIEATQLQIICSEIETRIVKRKEDEKKSETPSNGQRYTVVEEDLKSIGGIERIISNFYQNQVNELGSLKEQELARILIEDNMYDKDGRIRKMLFEKTVLNILKKAREEQDMREIDSSKFLGKLLSLRLIREDHREGQKFYEISHDYLLGAIGSSYDERESTRLASRNAALRREREKLKQDKEALEQAIKRAKTAEKVAQVKKQEAVVAYNEIKASRKALRQRGIVLMILLVIILLGGITLFFYEHHQREEQNALTAQNYIFLGKESYEAQEYRRSFDLFQKADKLGDTAGLYYIDSLIFPAIYGNDIYYSSDNTLCMRVGQSGAAAVWRLSQRRYTWLYDIDSVSSALFSPDNKYVVINSLNSGYQLLNIEGKTPEPVRVAGREDFSMLPAGVRINVQQSCEFSADGKYLLLNRNSVLANTILFNLAHRNWYPVSDVLEQAAPQMLNRDITCRFSADSKALAIHQKPSDQGAPFLLDDLAANRILYAAPGVTSFVFCPAKPLLVTLNSKSVLQVRDYVKDEPLLAIPLSPVSANWSVSNSANGKYLTVSDGNSQSVYIMDYETLSWRKNPLYDKDHESEMYLVDGAAVCERWEKGQLLLYNFSRKDAVPVTPLSTRMVARSASLKRLYYIGTDTILNVVGMPELQPLRRIRTGISRPVGIVAAKDDSTLFVFDSLGRTSEVNAETGTAALSGRSGFGIEKIIGARLDISPLQGQNTRSKQMIVSREYLKMNRKQKQTYLKALYKVP